jgi:hypothetical protein
MERIIKMKINYFIKREGDQIKASNLIKQKKKVKNIGRTKPKKEKKKRISTPHISTTTRRFQLQELSNNKAATC